MRAKKHNDSERVKKNFIILLAALFIFMIFIGIFYQLLKASIEVVLRGNYSRYGSDVAAPLFGNSRNDDDTLSGDSSDILVLAWACRAVGLMIPLKSLKRTY